MSRFETTEKTGFILLKAKCAECDRVFDLTKDLEAGEWFYGHDCRKINKKN
jgi:hypothetical protein